MYNHIDEDLSYRAILESTPLQKSFGGDWVEDLLEGTGEDPVTRAAAAKKGWDKRGRGRHQRGKVGRSKAAGRTTSHFPHYSATPAGLKDEFNSLGGWQQAAQARGHTIALRHAGKHSHHWVALDHTGKKVGHFNHDQTVAAKHQGRLY